jgi:lipopolysaccharide export LptBFGC system permease protein LptF
MPAYPARVRIVSRYLVREFATSSAGVLAGLLVTWLAGDSLRRIGDFAREWRQALRQLGLISTEILPYAVPIACLAGTVWTLSRAVRNRELVALRSGGIPLRRALAPLLVAAGVVSAGLGLFVDRVLIPARIALERGDASEPGRPRELAGRYWKAHPPFVFSAARYDTRTHALLDVVIFKLDEAGRVAERIDAEQAINLEGNVWELRNARIRNFSDAGGIGTARHEDLRLDLGVEGRAYERARTPAGQLSLHRMARALRTSEPETRPALSAAFHGRVLEPLSTLILVLFAIPLGVRDVERGDSLPRALLRALGFALAFWLSWTLAVFASRLPGVPPFVPTWALVIGALLLGSWRYREITE